MAHSNQVREFLLTEKGVDLIDVYVGPGGMLTGAARVTQEARDEAEETISRQKAERRLREIERRRKVRDAQIEALKAESESDEEETERISEEENLRETALSEGRRRLSRIRKADDFPINREEKEKGSPNDR
jgi:circadian clock protein KaiC